MFEDLVAALRRLRRQRRYAVTAAVVLGLGVAVVTAAFALVDGVLVRPLPLKDSSRLVLAPRRVGPKAFHAIAARTTVFSRTTLAGLGLGMVATQDGLRRIWAMEVSPNFFSMVGLVPRPGRGFTRKEYAGAGPRPVLISSRLRAKLFPPDAPVIGKTIRLNSRLRRVVGVVPPPFLFRLQWATPPVSIWVPLVTAVGGRAGTTAAARQPGATYETFLLARLKRGVSLATAQADLNGVVGALAAQQPQYKALRGMPLMPLPALWIGPAGQVVWPLFGMSFAFLVIAGLNIGGLGMARRIARGGEFAIRAALGASRSDLMALGLAEGFWIGAGGAIVGALLALGLIGIFRATAPAGLLPRLSGVAVNWGVAGFAACASLLCGLLAGALAAVGQASHPAESLAQAGAGRSASLGAKARWGGKALVLAQCAGATLLLAVAGLLLLGIWRLTHAPLGFRPQGVIQANVLPASANPGPAAARYRLWARLRRRVAGLPGVQAAAVADGSYGDAGRLPVRVTADGTAAGGMAQFVNVGPGYLRTLGIPLLAGRGFSPDGRPGTPLLAIVNQAFVRIYFGGAEALGREIQVQFEAGSSKWERVRVVGVMGDTAIAGTWKARDSPQILTDLYQHPSYSEIVLARVAPGAYPNLRAFRRAVANANPDLVVTKVSHTADTVAEALAQPRFLARLIAVLAVLGLLLAFAGVYGTVALEMRSRRRELGIRRALGAPGPTLMWQLLWGVAIVGILGVAVGVVAAAALGDTFRAWLFGFPQPVAGPLVVAAAVVLVAGLLGSLLPGRASLREELGQVLRSE